MKLFLRFGNFIVLALIILLAIIGLNESGFIDKHFNKSKEEIIIKSDIDYDNDGIDDYTDILNGAKKFINNKPKYKSAYYSGGYPTDDYYVCTDLIWFSLKEAGYDFKELIDKDIKDNKEDYDIDKPDSNIDFRRVRNIKVYLDKYALSLTTDGEDYTEFWPGDIVVYSNHIAIVGDKSNKDNVKYIIHHDGYHKYEEDGLLRNKIIGHYRWRIESDKQA